MNIQLLACVVVLADCMKLDGSLRIAKPASGLKERGLKRNLKRIRKKHNPRLLGKKSACGVGAGQTLFFRVLGMHSPDMLVCHPLGHLAFLVPSLKHLCSPSASSPF